MRQVGKTTLLKQIGRTYATLDDDEVSRRFELGNWSQIESGKPPMVIDEAQKCPGLFDRIKLIVDQNRRPGQFLLTGSVRFLSRKQIRESLTGRTSILELLPLTLAETHSLPLTDFAGQAVRQKPEVFLAAWASRKHFKRKGAEDYMCLGGLPGVCFKRESQVRQRMQEAHLETLLMRDLQMLIKTRIPYTKLRTLLSALALAQGQSLSLSDLGRRVQLSTPTVIQLLGAFEALFIIRSHGKSWFLSDCGMAHFLGVGAIENPLFHMERFIFQELHAQLNYLHKARFRLYPHLTRGGARIPFVVELEGLPTVAVVADPTDGASEKSLKSLTWFSKKHRRPVIPLVLHRGTKGYRASTSAICLPYEWIA